MEPKKLASVLLTLPDVALSTQFTPETKLARSTWGSSRPNAIIGAMIDVGLKRFRTGASSGKARITCADHGSRALAPKALSYPGEHDCSSKAPSSITELLKVVQICPKKQLIPSDTGL